MRTFEDTVALIKKIYEGRFDDKGLPYWNHSVAVMESLGNDSPVAKQVALLHDVLEDTGWTYDDLIRVGFSNEVVEAVRLLTRSGGVTYFDYIRSIIDSQNDIAIKVKIADLRHNLYRGKPPGDLTRRYLIALTMLGAA